MTDAQIINKQPQNIIRHTVSGCAKHHRRSICCNATSHKLHNLENVKNCHLMQWTNDWTSKQILKVEKYWSLYKSWGLVGLKQNDILNEDKAIILITWVRDKCSNSRQERPLWSLHGYATSGVSLYTIWFLLKAKRRQTSNTNHSLYRLYIMSELWWSKVIRM